MFKIISDNFNEIKSHSGTIKSHVFKSIKQVTVKNIIDEILSSSATTGRIKVLQLSDENQYLYFRAGYNLLEKFDYCGKGFYDYKETPIKSNNADVFVRYVIIEEKDLATNFEIAI